jgi:hypothetical protein
MKTLVALIVFVIIAGLTIYLAVTKKIGPGLTTILLVFSLAAGSVIDNHDLIKKLKLWGMEVETAKREITEAKESAIKEIMTEVKEQKESIQLLMSNAKETHEKMEKQKESLTAMGSDIEKLKSQMSVLQENMGKELNSQFPDGYQLFGILNGQIIPSPKPSSEELKISWSTAKILKVTKDFVDIMLPDSILPGNIVFKGNTVSVKNEEGYTSGGFEINGWRSIVKILKSRDDEIIALVGWVKIR